MNKTNPGPRYLDLLRIKMPVGAVTSIAHRLSGVLLFFGIPVLIWLLDLSLRGPEGFARIQAMFDGSLVRLGSVLVIWALVHHLLAGIRFLLLDLHLGIGLQAARASALAVTVSAIVITLVYGVSLL